MADPPTTRVSLVVRLSDPGDLEAWEEFVKLYLPLLYRMARRKGLQPADAEELGQEVLLSVSKAVHRWAPDGERARFRDWLFTIARNAIINFLTRAKGRRIASGSSDVWRLLNEIPETGTQDSAVFDLEFQREAFRWACERIRATVSETTWQAFWRSTVDELPIAAVAQELSLNIGAVYVARSRVMTKLKQQIGRIGNQRVSPWFDATQECAR